MSTITRITSANPAGQEHQHVLDLPPAPTDPTDTPTELKPTEHLKRMTSDQIARSLIIDGKDELRRLSDKLFDCSESVSLKRSGAVHSHSRCKHRLCALCSSISASKWQKEIDRSMDHLKYDLIEDSKHPEETTLAALKVTLNAGQTCPAHELKTIIRDVLHTLWPRLLKIKAIAPHLEGAIRATEITVSKEPMVDDMPLMNPHIHATILLRVPHEERSTWRAWLDNIALSAGHYWVGAVSRRLEKLGIDRPITLSSQEIMSITAQTTEHLAGWMQYGVKGAVTSLATALHKEDYTATALKPIASIWTEVYRAIKGIRLIAISGSLSDSLDDAREELKRESDRCDRTEETKPEITHRWSYPRNKFIPADLWSADTDKPPYYRNRLYLLYFRHKEYRPEERRDQHRTPAYEAPSITLTDELFLYTQESQGGDEQ